MAAHVLRRLCRISSGVALPQLRRVVLARGLATSEETTDPAEETQSSEAPRIQGDPYFGISTAPFPKRVTGVLLAPVNKQDVEIKPDGMIYLPEIKYRRILNIAFGPGGWAMMPRGETLQFQAQNSTDTAQLVTREYALYCQGRFVSQAVGEHTFYSKGSLSYGKACESAKSNALMRCCKDLGVASELWDPQFVEAWRAEHADDVWCENVRTKDKKKLWRKKNSNSTPFAYPWKATR